MVANNVLGGITFRVYQLCLMVVVIVAPVVASGNGVAEAERFEAVMRYWEWKAYWRTEGVDFPVVRYRSGSSFSALVFVPTDVQDGGPYWGFCSNALHVCQSYFAWADGTVFNATAIRINRNETEHQALRRFRDQEFTADAPVPSANPATMDPPSSRASTADPSLLIGGQRYRVDVDVKAVRRIVKLPALQPPLAIRRRTTNQKLIQFVRELVRLSKPNTGCRVVVPFADEHAPDVPILVACPTTNEVNFLRRQGHDWTATAGGVVSDPKAVRLYTDRILRNASIVLQP